MRQGGSSEGFFPPPFCLLRRHFPRRGNFPLIFRLGRRKTNTNLFLRQLCRFKNTLSHWRRRSALAALRCPKFFARRLTRSRRISTAAGNPNAFFRPRRRRSALAALRCPKFFARRSRALAEFRPLRETRTPSSAPGGGVQVSHLHVAPQGRNKPLSVTGRPSSWLSLWPPNFLVKMLSHT